MSTFKPGDKVYCPLYGTEIFVLEKSLIFDYDVVLYSKHRGHISFSNDGKYFQDCGVPMLFHATVKNHALLEQLYGMEFEKPPAPPAKPTSREIIQAMLERGDKYVPCWASHLRETPNHSNAWVFIYSVSERFFTDGSGTSWQYATPIDTRTGQPITELPNQ